MQLLVTTITIVIVTQVVLERMYWSLELLGYAWEAGWNYIASMRENCISQTTSSRRIHYLSKRSMLIHCIAYFYITYLLHINCSSRLHTYTWVWCVVYNNNTYN